MRLIWIVRTSLYLIVVILFLYAKGTHACTDIPQFIRPVLMTVVCLRFLRMWKQLLYWLKQFLLKFATLRLIKLVFILNFLHEGHCVLFLPLLHLGLSLNHLFLSIKRILDVPLFLDIEICVLVSVHLARSDALESRNNFSILDFTMVGSWGKTNSLGGEKNAPVGSLLALTLFFCSVFNDFGISGSDVPVVDLNVCAFVLIRFLTIHVY